MKTRFRQQPDRSVLCRTGDLSEIKITRIAEEKAGQRG
jgi:hypothetical protein